MWTVMICDDEEMMRASIRQNLEKFSAETGEQFTVREVASGEALLAKFSEDIDLVFLDIKMDGMTGMDAARKLRKQNHNVCIIFITTMVQYAMEGYEVHAYGFMKKPLKYAQFRLQMLDALRHITPRHTDSITLKTGREVRVVSLPQLIYLEVLDHDLRFVMVDGSLTCHGSMNDIGEGLKGKGFFRCHKSYTVNFAHVSRVTSSGVILSNGDEIPVSKHRRKEFLEALAGHAGGNL